MRLAVAAAALCLMLGSANRSQATIVSGTYHFAASDFTIILPTPSGVSGPPLTGSVTLTFDNSADVSPTTAGIVSSAFSIDFGNGEGPYTLASALGFTYDVDTDRLLIGGTEAGVTGFVLPGGQDLSVVISSASSANPELAVVSYSIEIGFLFASGTGKVTFTAIPDLPTGIPEPASLALLGPALFAFGLRRRALRRVQRRHAPPNSI